VQGERLAAALVNRTIEALVIAASKPPESVAKQDSLQQPYRISLLAEKQQFEVSSDRSLPPGTRLTITVISPSRFVVKAIHTPEKTGAQQLLDNGLRQALPRQQPHQRLVRQLLQLAEPESNNEPRQTVPRGQATSTPARLPPELTMAIRRFLQALPTPVDLQTTAGVKQAINQSGLFLENKLMEHRQAMLYDMAVRPAQRDKNSQHEQLTTRRDDQTPTKPAKNPGQPGPSPRQTTHQRLQFLASKLTAPQIPEPVPTPRATPQPAPVIETAPAPASGRILSPTQGGHTEKTTEKAGTPRSTAPGQNADSAERIGRLLPANTALDFKASLLRLADALYHAIPTGPRSSIAPLLGLTSIIPAINAGETSGRPANATNALYTNNGTLQAQAPGNPQANLATGGDATNQAGNELQLMQQLLASLARTQFQQLSSIAGEAAAPGDSTPPTSLQLEIPIVNGNQVESVSIQINEEEQSTGSGEQADNHEQTWRIMLSFEFDSLGMFYAQLRLIRDSVSATFWAEKRSTATAIRTDFNTLAESLAESGITVTELQCHHGKPPTEKTAITNSLISVRT
jgi:hypothetical protein